MTLPFYPIALTVLPGLAPTVRWSPVFFNQSFKAQNGASIDIQLASTPLHNFEVSYNFLRDIGRANSPEFRIMLGFWMAIGGSAGRFLFQNPDDQSVTTQTIANGDGVTTAFTAIRTIGTSLGYGTEPVGQWITTLPYNVYVNGVLKTAGSDYTINTAQPVNSTIVFSSAPPVGVNNITADFSYAYYCRFADDSLTFEKFIDQIWSAQSVKIQSCRLGA